MKSFLDTSLSIFQKDWALVTAGSMENCEELLELLQKNNPAETAVVILPGCNHGNGMYKQTEMYQSAIKELVERHMA